MWQYLETILVVTAGRGVLLVANEWSSETLIDGQDGPHHTELSGLKGGQGQV